MKYYLLGAHKLMLIHSHVTRNELERQLLSESAQ